MEELDKKMDDHGLTRSSKLTYLRVLEYLHGKPVDDLSFFMNREVIDEKLAHLKPNTKRVYYIAIHSALRLSNPDAIEGTSTGDLIQYYRQKMMRIAQHHHKIRNLKTKTQQDNWVEWEDVLEKWDEMNEQYLALKAKHAITHDYEYNFLLHFTVLTLYVKLLPRRNADYIYMIISQKRPEVFDTERNYLILEEKKFIFNRYKTAQIYGRQEVDIPEEVLEILYFYIFSRKQDLPTLGVDLKKGKTIPLFLQKNGNCFTESNCITRCLNKIFAPKHIGSAMLRTIFATEMLADDQAKSQYLAEGMCHSVGTQQNIYIKHS